jgi:sodium/hydrogen antiporter
LSSVPLVAAYSRWYAAHAAKHPSASEEKPTIMSRLRHHPAPEKIEPEETEPVTAQPPPSP